MSNEPPSNQPPPNKPPSDKPPSKQSSVGSKVKKDLSQAPKRPPRRPGFIAAEEEDEKNNSFRIFTAAVAIAMIAGLSVRFYFSPDRLREWFDLALSHQASKMKIEFRSAELKLSEGAIPQLAVELQGVKLSKVIDECPQTPFDPAIEAERLRIPLRVSSLLFGNVSIGTLGADGLNIDLDRLKQSCPVSKAPKVETAHEILVATEKVASQKSVSRTTLDDAWWTDEQYDKIAQLIHGFSFRNTRVVFENGTKWIEFESVSAEMKTSSKQIHARANLRVPRALTQGEQIPDLYLDANLSKDSGDANLAARLSEGTLRGQAHLLPLADKQLDIDARVNLANVPLSTLVPLLTKTALVKRDMHPKFLWLNCEAAIHGKFQGLFQSNPLRLSKCDVQGNGTNLHLENAVRLPTGKWEPFTAQIVSADVRQVLEAFSFSGLDGIMNDYGQMQGEVRLDEHGGVKIAALFHGAQLRFSNRSVRVLQDIKALETQVEFEPDGRISGKISRFEFDGGEFDGQLRFDLPKHDARGVLNLDIKSLKLAQDVQRVMLGGTAGQFKGEVSANLIDGKLTALKGSVHLADLSTTDWEFADLLIQPGLDESGNILVNLKSPELKLKSSSAVFAAARLLVFHLPTFDEPEIAIKDFVLPAVVPKEGGLRWKNAKGTLEHGRVKIMSEAEFSREHELLGKIQIDFPKVKKLSWDVSGTTTEPEFEFSEKSASPAFLALAKDSKVTEATLGLPPSSKGSQSRDESSLSEGATKDTEAARGAGERLRELGESVMERARGMIPKAKATNEGN